VRTISAPSILTSWVLVLAFSSPAAAQTSSLPDAPQPSTRDQATLRNTPRNILHDQVVIWTSPARLNESNAIGPVLLVLGTTVLATTDHQVMSSHFTDKSLNDLASTASDGLVGGFIAAPVLLYGLGRIRHSDDDTETGILAGEAIVDSIAVNEALKIVSRRERPTLDNAKGRFFQSGVGFDSSFASNHAIIAWSSAAVLASEPNGLIPRLAIYSLASGVSVSRVLARQHFPSDVLVGSAVGWMIGRYVQHHHRRNTDE
jgi:hypothetical protein